MNDLSFLLILQMLEAIQRQAEELEQARLLGLTHQAWVRAEYERLVREQETLQLERLWNRPAKGDTL